jgi:hypothetical protein
MAVKRKKENPNDHKKATPVTKGKEHVAQAFTSYDTSKKETATPQKARESREASDEHARIKKADGRQ